MLNISRCAIEFMPRIGLGYEQPQGDMDLLTLELFTDGGQKGKNSSDSKTLPSAILTSSVHSCFIKLGLTEFGCICGSRLRNLYSGGSTRVPVVQRRSCMCNDTACLFYFFQPVWTPAIPAASGIAMKYVTYSDCKPGRP